MIKQLKRLRKLLKKRGKGRAMARKSGSGGMTFIIFIAIVGLVLSGIILRAPKTQAPSDGENGASQVKEDQNLISNDNSVILGKKDAPVKVTVFSDYLCPYCRELHETLNSTLEKNSEKVAVELRNFVVHPQAEILAKAAYAASLQGKAKEANDLLFSKYTDSTEENVVKMAEELKLDIGKFKKDLNSSKVTDIIKKDNDDARDLGLQGTPSVFLNGKYLEDVSQIEDKINELIKK